jgi:hypothetical protein
MSKRLVSNISSDYIAAVNRLKPCRSKKTIVVYVESYGDITFWRDVLDEYETSCLHFEVMLPSRTTLGKGKKTAMMNNLGPYMIACVDADYDWLLQGKTHVSQELCNSPYVLHTYVYAIENYHCYAEGLHRACTRAALNDREVVNLEAYMEEYSKVVWPLFVWNIWTYRHGRDNEFGITHFIDTITYHDVNIHSPELTIDYVRRRVNKKVNWLQQHFPEGKKTYSPLRDELLQMGLTPESTYLYIQGHGLMDGVVLPLLHPICTQLRRERERDINKLAVHETQRQNELSGYRNSCIPIENALKKSMSYRQSQPYAWLKSDIEKLLLEVKASSAVNNELAK